MRNPEILAPAGSYDSMVAAYNAGADAVYMGGSVFGARAYADNPDDDRLKEAIRYAHLHGKKLYLTVNTLLKNDELGSQLYDFLAPLYEQGLDAVLVQDIGVLCFIRKYFPELPVHASTQMTVLSPEYTRWLMEKGVRRIVLPRELSISEIREIKEAGDIEAEVFIHGALCYCYSGQCLMSSMMGGRSGNRGRCAQPCRLLYNYEDKNSHTRGYLLCTKDLMGLNDIPDLIDAGVDSLKIEGRMKRPEYAALTSYLYKKYTDMYLLNGRSGYHVEQDDINSLLDIYNRGGFTKGYFHLRCGREMMSLDKPDNSGLEIGRASVKIYSGKENRSKKGRENNSKRNNSGADLQIIADKDLNKGDIIQVRSSNAEEKDIYTITLKESIPAGRKYALKASDTGSCDIRTGSYPVFRVRNNALIEELSAEYVTDSKLKEKIYGFVNISKDLPAKMVIYDGDLVISTEGALPQPAKTKALTDSVVRDQLTKTGGSPFEFEKLEITLDDGLFMTVRELNALRRDALEQLEEKKSAVFRRSVKGTFLPVDKHISSMSGHTAVSVSVRNTDQLSAVLSCDEVSRIYADLYLDEAFLRIAAKKVKEAGKEFYLAGPHIFREHIRKTLNGQQDLIKDLSPDGFLIRNIDSFFLLKKLGFKGDFVSDTGIYCMNDTAADEYLKLFDRLTVPLELNRTEIMHLADLNKMEMIVYGKVPLMVSAQCLTSTTDKCRADKSSGILTDRIGMKMKTESICTYCYGLIYNAVPLFIPEIMDGDLSGRYPASVRIQLLDEGAEETEYICRAICGCLSDNSAGKYLRSVTRGHYRRGVK